MNEKKTERIQIKISPTLKAAAQEQAAKNNRTLSNYICWLIEKNIKETEKDS